MNRRSLAIWIVLFGILVGIVGDIVFYEKMIGLSVPLFTAAATAALLLLGWIYWRSLPWRNLWLLLPLLFFAAMVAVLDSGSVTIFNLLALLALAGLVLYYLPGSQFIDRSSVAQHLVGIIASSFATVVSPVAVLFHFWAGLRDVDSTGETRRAMRAVVRGLLLAIPVVFVFALLLGAADAIFASYMQRVWDLLNIKSLEDLIGQVFLIGALAWLSWGALAFGVGRTLLFSPDPKQGYEDDPFAEGEPEGEARSARQEKQPGALNISGPLFKIGFVESSIVLGSVDLLFAAFVLIQLTYFFGGTQNITVDGLTYAEYARRGFFELVAVSVLTLGLALLLDNMTVREKRWHHTLFRTLTVIVVALTGIMLISAWQRMDLYESAYGYTHLRLYTKAFMAWMGVLFLVYVLSLFRLRAYLFSLGLIVVVCGYLVTLNMLNPDALIAGRNIARYWEGHELDMYYLNALSPDAVPVILDFYDQTAAADQGTHRCIGLILDNQQDMLERQRNTEAGTIFSFNVSRQRAWDLLTARPGNWSPYSWSDFYNNCYNATASGGIKR